MHVRARCGGGGDFISLRKQRNLFHWRRDTDPDQAMRKVKFSSQTYSFPQVPNLSLSFLLISFALNTQSGRLGHVCNETRYLFVASRRRLAQRRNSLSFSRKASTQSMRCIVVVNKVQGYLEIFHATVERIASIWR